MSSNGGEGSISLAAAGNASGGETPPTAPLLQARSVPAALTGAGLQLVLESPAAPTAGGSMQSPTPRVAVTDLGGPADAAGAATDTAAAEDAEPVGGAPPAGDGISTGDADPDVAAGAAAADSMATHDSSRGEAGAGADAADAPPPGSSSVAARTRKLRPRAVAVAAPQHPGSTRRRHAPLRVASAAAAGLQAVARGAGSSRTPEPAADEPQRQQQHPQADGDQKLLLEQLTSALSIYGNGLVLGAGRLVEVGHRILLHAVGKADAQAFEAFAQAVVELSPKLHQVLSGLPDTIAVAFQAAAALHRSEDLGPLLEQARQLRNCCSGLSGDLGAVLGSQHGVPGLQALMLDQPQHLDRYHDGMRDAFALGEADGNSSNSATIADMFELLQDCSTRIQAIHTLLQRMSSSS